MWNGMGVGVWSVRWEWNCVCVHSRARSENQKNFQLIIITHDEAFVELLGHAGYTDCFYRVTKSFG